MRHYFRVIEYLQSMGCHKCQASDAKNGKYDFIDLQIDKHTGISDEDLVGKIVSMDYHYPYISIGMDVKIED